jgi:signal transduction histidine kinase/CheY-like chemotaxis protein
MTLFPRATSVRGGQLEAFLSAVHPDDRDAIRAELRAVLAGEKSSYDIVYRAQIPGRPVRVLHAIADLIVEDGRPVRLVGTAQDITERQALQEQLALSDRMASVGTLAAGVAHEINNPLAYTIVNVDYALRSLRTGSPEDRQELLAALTSAKEGCERIRVIVKDLQTFSRPGENDRFGPVDIARAMESAMTMAAAEVRHRARVVRDFRSVPTAHGNEARLGQVFLNLIMNAVQAITEEGAADRNTITLATRTDGAGRIVAEIRDTGAGIPADVLPKIFDPFFTTKPVGVGTGLGLTVCHGIVQSAGGTMEVESTPGKGTLVRVILLPSRAATENTLVVGPTPSGRTRGRVFVIDDEELLTKAIARSLGEEHDVVVFHRTRDACERLAAGEPCDAVLCDLMMPEMTGVDLYEELQQRRPALLDRFLFTTGGVFTSRARDFLKAVPNRCLYKPFDMPVLASAVRELVRTGASGQSASSSS